jgi:hypothetical protein
MHGRLSYSGGEPNDGGRSENGVCIGHIDRGVSDRRALASLQRQEQKFKSRRLELQRLNLLKKNHLDDQYVARRSVRDLPGTIASLTERLAKVTADEATTNAHASDPIAIGGRTCTHAKT